MNKYIIGGTIVVLLIIAGVYGFTNKGTQKSTNVAEQIKTVSSSITVAEPLRAFGDVDLFGKKSQATYTLKNNGTEDVTILAGVTSCSCTSAVIGALAFGMHQSTNKKVVIPAGGEKEMVVTFDPLVHGPDFSGRVQREVYLKTNSTATPEVTVAFTANVLNDKKTK